MQRSPWQYAQARRWPDLQCEVSVAPPGPTHRGLSPGPQQHSSCSLITQQARVYSRANGVTSATTPCKVIKTGQEHVIQVGQCVTRTLFSCYYVILAMKDMGRLFNLKNPIRGPAHFLPLVLLLDDKKKSISDEDEDKSQRKTDYKSSLLLVENIKKSLSPIHSMHSLD